MDYILHQRDDTMRQGIRTSKHSLRECISCHNAPAEDGKVARISEKEHFCNTCHTYAAVKIDCFDCHTDKPQDAPYRHSSLETNKNNKTPNLFAAKGQVK